MLLSPTLCPIARKRRREFRMALGYPQQRPHRIAHGRGFEQALQIFQQRGSCVRRVRRCQAGEPDLLGVRLSEVLQAATDRATRDARGPRRGLIPPIRRLRLRRGEQTTSTLVQTELPAGNRPRITNVSIISGV